METSDFAFPPSVVDMLLDVVCMVDETGRFVFVSAACERVFGYLREEMVGKPMIEFVAPQDRVRTLAAAGKIMAGHSHLHFENRYVRKDGKLVHIMWSARWSETDRLRIAVARDITERKRAEAMQAAQYAILEAAGTAEDFSGFFRQVHRIIGELVPARRFYAVLAELDGGSPYIAYHADEGEAGAASALIEDMHAELVRSGQSLLMCAESGRSPEPASHAGGKPATSWLAVALSVNRGVIGGLFFHPGQGGANHTEMDKDLLRLLSAQVAAAVERRQMFARLEYSAQYDELTDLPNRRLFFDRLKTALARAGRHGTKAALLYVDLDKFKHVNDTHGHGIGDLLLQQVAKRLKACVREVDTVARIGGDEFVVLLEGAGLPEHAEQTAARIRSALCQPFVLNGIELHMFSSIGIALYPEHGNDHERLLKHADAAMYVVKKHTAGVPEVMAKADEPPGD